MRTMKKIFLNIYGGFSIVSPGQTALGARPLARNAGKLTRLGGVHTLPRMKRITVLPALVLLSGSLFAQERSLNTEPASTVPEGMTRFGLGFEHFQDATFRLSGLKGNLTRAGVCDLRFGVGPKAELQMGWTVQESLAISERFPAPHTEKLAFSGNSTSDYGDLFVGSKVRFLDEKNGWPAMGLHFLAQIPIASNETGIGNDVTNIFSALVMERRFGRLRGFINMGLALLGDPLDAAAQDDLVLYGVGMIYPITSKINLVGDFYGRAGSGRHTGIPVSPDIIASRSGIGTEQQKRMRIALEIRVGGIYLDLGGFAGLRDTDPSYGVAFGLSKEFKSPF